MIAITVARRVTYINTSYKIKPSQWAENAVKDYPNFRLINAKIRKQIADLEERITTWQLEGVPVTPRMLKGDVQDKNFFKFAHEIRLDQKELNRLINFAGSALMLSDITVQFLRKFTERERSRGMANNTINTTCKYLRRIITQAYKERLIKENPFDAFQVPRYIQSDRTFLTLEEIDKIEAYIKTCQNDNLYTTALWFLFGCYTGLRYSDWVIFDISKHIQDTRLILRAKKNKGLVSLKIFPRLRNILDKLSSKPYSSQYTNFYLKQIAVAAGISKKITCHTSRHSFCVLLATLGVSSDTAAELIGVNKQTVNVYYKITGAKTDKETSVLQGL